MSPTTTDQGEHREPKELARAALWFDDQLGCVVVTIDWRDEKRPRERIEFERLQLATEFLQRNEFRPMPQHSSIWLLEALPENVVCIEEWQSRS